MLGSSSTTSNRASGARVSGPGIAVGELPATVPPVTRAEAIVMARSVVVQAGVALDATCELPGTGAGAVRTSAGGRRHGAAVPPVPDRVVLRPAETPPRAQIGPDGP